MLGKVWRNGNSLHCWWECKLVQSLWRTVWRFLKKLKIELPYDPATPLLGIYLEKTVIQKDTYTTKFTAALFAISRTWKQLKCSSADEWMKKIWYIYTMEYYSAIKKEWNNAICNNVNGPRGYHTKSEAIQTKTNITWYHLYGNLKRCYKWIYS